MLAVQLFSLLFLTIAYGQQYYFYGNEGGDSNGVIGPYASPSIQQLPVIVSYNETKGPWGAMGSGVTRDSEDSWENEDEEAEDEEESSETSNNRSSRLDTKKLPDPWKFPITPGLYYNEYQEQLKADPGNLEEEFDDHHNRRGRFLWPFSLDSKSGHHKPHGWFPSDYEYDHRPEPEYHHTVPDSFIKELADKKAKKKYDLFNESKFKGLTKEDYWILHSRGYRKYRRKKRKKIRKLKKKLKLKRVIQKILEKKIERLEMLAPEEPYGWRR